MNDSHKILTKIVKMMSLAPKDETRPHLMGVHLEWQEGVGMTAQVCDGHRLVKETFDPECDWGLGETKLLMSPFMIPSIKAELKSNKYGIDVSYKDGRLTIGDTILHVVVAESYPDTEQLIPTFKPTFEVAFNAKLLAEMGKAMKESRNDTVKLSFKDALSPIIVSVKDNQARAVLMPCRF